MNVSVLAAEGGWQEFELRGGEWLILLGSAATALLALAVGLYLVKGVLAADAGTPKMQEIAVAIQEGAWAYLKRQFRTIGFILIPLAVIVFVSSVAIENEDGTEVLSFAASGTFRTMAFIAGCVPVGAHRLHRHDAGDAGQRAHRGRGAWRQDGTQRSRSRSEPVASPACSASVSACSERRSS